MSDDGVAEVDFEWMGAIAPVDPAGDSPSSNLGDQVDGAGTAAAAPMRATLGFYGGAAPADANGCAVMLQMTLGHDRTVVAATDDRELVALDVFGGAPRISTDRFVTAYGKNSRVELRTSGADSVGLYGAQGRQILLDDAGGTISMLNGSGSVSMQAGQVVVKWAPPGGPLQGTVTISNAGIVLSFTNAIGVTCSVALNALTGGVAIVAPGGMTLDIGGGPLPFLPVGGFWTT